jgi:hypothetical protein
VRGAAAGASAPGEVPRRGRISYAARSSRHRKQPALVLRTCTYPTADSSRRRSIVLDLGGTRGALARDERAVGAYTLNVSGASRRAGGKPEFASLLVHGDDAVRGHTQTTPARGGT